MRKQKLDEKRLSHLHLLGVGQLNYLHETRKISWHDAKTYTSDNSEKGLEFRTNINQHSRSGNLPLTYNLIGDENNKEL